MAGMKIPSVQIAPVELNPVGAEQTPLGLAKRGAGEGLAAGLKSFAGAAAGMAASQQADEAEKETEDNNRTLRIALGELNADDREWNDLAMALKGRDALPGPKSKGVAADTVDRYQKSFDRVSEDLSPELKEALAQMIFRSRESAIDKYSGHETAQGIFVDGQLSDAAKLEATLKAHDNSSDEKVIDASIETIEEENFSVPGVPEEVALVKTFVEASALWRETSKLLAEHDPAAARERLERKRAEGVLTEPDYQEALKHVDTERVHQSSSNWVNANWSNLKANGGDLTLRQLQDLARETFKDDVAMADEVVKRLRERNVSDEKSVAKEKSARNESDYTSITKDMALRTVEGKESARKTMLLNPDPVFQEKMRAYINGDELVTDMVRNNQLLQMARDPTREAEFLAIDPMNEPLSTRDRNKLYDNIESVGLGENIGEIAIAADMGLIVEQYVEQESYGDKQALRLYVRLEEEIKVFFEREHRNPDAAQMRDMAKSLIANVDWRFWDNQPALDFERGDFSEFDSGVVLALGIVAVPYNRRPELRARLRRMKPNQAVTDMQIVRLFLKDVDKLTKKDQE